MADVVLNIKAQIADLQKDMKKVQKGQKDMASQSTKTQKTMQKNIQGTTKSMQGFGKALIAVFSIAAVTQLTKAIISVRSEFAKYEAVLTNTLGSAAAANREFEKIKKFAAETPFSVQGLTDAFVRLVNQGFKPTMKQMRQLGDLAASTGKDFLQLTEAILDAQTGEFERLKEFGIKTKKEGDKVTFTFKEQATQVAFTSKAIQEYILSLGDAVGVSGAMDAIAKTLGGKISNLNDAWDVLLGTLGERTEGVFGRVIEVMNKMLASATELFAEFDPKKGASISMLDFRESLEGLEKEKVLDKIAQQFQTSASKVEFYHMRIAELREELSGPLIRALGQMDPKFTDNQRTIALSIEIYEEWIQQQKVEQEELKKLSKEVALGKEILDGDTDAKEEQITTINTLSEQIKKLEKDKKNLNIADTQGIININRQILGIKSLLKALKKLGEPENIKPLKLGEDIKFDEDAIFGKETEDIFKEQRRAKEGFDSWWKKSEEDRLDDSENAELRKQLLFEGTANAAMAGLDLIAAANKDNAEVQKAVAIAQAIINGALGITRTGAELGYPLAIPFQIALGLQTLAQIATIRQQKFERGGYDVLKGRRHAQGGVDIGIGEAEAGEGLAVFSREATQKYGKFLPAFVKAINENDADLGYSDGAYMISFDDSKSVSKLEDIRQLLSKPEIRYEGRYRVETRKGQTTRVKL